MTTSGPTSTYRYVSDGGLTEAARRDALKRVRHPAAVVGLVLVGLGFGIVSSLIVNSDSLPTYLGRVLLIGLAWGLIWMVLVVLMVAIVLVPVLAANTRYLTRRFPLGSVTEVELGDESLTIRRPSGGREVPYRKIHVLRPRGSLLALMVRGRLRAELLPLGLLPDDAVELVRARSRGARPPAARPDAGTPTRRFVVPDGWAAHLASEHVRANLLDLRTWRRIAAVLVVSALVALLTTPWVLLVPPGLMAFAVVANYVQSRRMFTRVLPAGSVATTEFLEDRFFSRNTGGAREIAFDDVRSVHVRGDVVLLGLESLPGLVYLARELFPDHALEHLRELALNRRSAAGG